MIILQVPALKLIKFHQMFYIQTKDLNVEHLEYRKAYLIKKINVNCDAINNLDS